MANGHGGARRINFIKDQSGEITGCEIEGGGSSDLLRVLTRMFEIIKGGETATGASNARAKKHWSVTRATSRSRSGKRSRWKCSRVAATPSWLYRRTSERDR